MRFTTSLFCLALTLPAWGAPSPDALSELRADVSVASEAVQQAQPAALAHVLEQNPFTARNGIARFDDAMGPAALVAERILGDADTIDTKVALIDALRRTEGTQWQGWMASLAEHANHPAMREAATEQLRYVDTTWSLPALRSVMNDPNPRVREAAVRAAGRLAPAEAPIEDLIRRLRDTDDAVAGFAARSLGWLHVTEAQADIHALLTRDNERTRRDAQNALDRLQNQTRR